MTTIWIKGMVCPRCIRVVKEDLEKAYYVVNHVELGKAIVEGHPNLDEVNTVLKNSGFLIVKDAEEKLVEEIKAVVIELIETDYYENNYKTNSAILEEKMNLGYTKLSKVFSSIMGTTLERYIIDRKIEKAKEFFKYSNFTIEDVAYKLGYSSTAHLSRQFKSFTGFSPSEFKSQFKKKQS